MSSFNLRKFLYDEKQLILIDSELPFGGAVQKRLFVSCNFKEVAQIEASILEVLPAETQVSFTPLAGDSCKQEILDRLESMMQGCSAILFIVGDIRHNSPWLAQEVRLAAEFQLPKYFVQAPGTFGAIPWQLTGQNSQKLNWNRKDLQWAFGLSLKTSAQ